MSEALPITESTAGKTENRNLLKRITFYVRETVASTVWLLFFVKIFVYDLDLLFVRRFEWLERFYPYKLFVIIGLISLVWVSLGTKRFLRTIGYVAIYPLVILFWRTPKLLVKNWALLIVFAPAIESVFFTLKWRFVFFSMAMLAGLGILLARQRFVLIGLTSFLGLFLVAHYVLRLRVTFRPSAIFANVAETVTTMWRHGVQTYNRKEFEARSGAGAQPSDYAKKHIENVKELYQQNLMWEFFANKLNQTVSSRRTDVYFIVAVVYSFVLTVTVFAFGYFALHKIDPSSFRGAEPVTFWTFLVFSFNVIMHTNFASVFPVSGAALAVANLELIAALVTLVLFVFILLTSGRERYRQDLQDVAKGLSQSSREIERFLEKKLKMRLIDAEAKIIEHNPEFGSVMESFGRRRTAGRNGSH